MKRVFSKQFLRSKWVVPASALILTLCIGSFALAGTGNDYGYSLVPTTSSTTSTTTSTTQPAATSSSTTTLSTPQFQVVDTTTPNTASTAPDIQMQEAKENAILDLIRDKMTTEDQAMFDQLRTIAAQKQMTLSQAQADLQATKAQITALVDKYLGVANGIDAGSVTGGAATTTTVEWMMPEL